MAQVGLELLTVAEGRAWAQAQVAAHHYLHTPVDVRSSPEMYAVTLTLPSGERWACGCLIVGRPEATRAYPWYGSVEDVQTGRASCTRWQVLNLARVWLHPDVQAGGVWYGPDLLPGFIDRRGRWHSALASTALSLLTARVGYDYLLRRPPVWPEEPYEIRWLLSYQDVRLHRGTIYAAAGFERWAQRGNIATWRTPLPALTAEQHSAVLAASADSPRARRFRGERERQRAQLALV